MVDAVVIIAAAAAAAAGAGDVLAVAAFRGDDLVWLSSRPLKGGSDVCVTEYAATLEPAAATLPCPPQTKRLEKPLEKKL